MPTLILFAVPFVVALSLHAAYMVVYSIATETLTFPPEGIFTTLIVAALGLGLVKWNDMRQFFGHSRESLKTEGRLANLV